MSLAAQKNENVKSAEETALLKRRRDTVVDAAEGFIEQQHHIEQVREEEKSKTVKQRLVELKNNLYDSETHKFLERDGLDWFKLAACYFVFYLCLSGAFIGLLAVFASTLDFNVPRYYDKESVMNYASPVNPGLGYRPQYNPESSFIQLNLSDSRTWKEEYVRTFDAFLAKYNALKGKEVNINPERTDRVVSSFDYAKILENTNCSKENDYGLAFGKPCIAIKMNRIYGWRPQPFSEPPAEFNVQVPESVKTGNKTNYLDRYVYVHCKGREAFDKDNIGKINYLSEYPGNDIGGLPAKYYPYKKQDNYLSPLVFIQLEGLSRNTLVNVECRAYARNIDNEDRRNQRGMVRFEIYLAA